MEKVIRVYSKQVKNEKGTFYYCKTTLKDELSLQERLEQYVYLKPSDRVFAKFVKGNKVF